jgi:hypothetical protein
LLRTNTKQRIYETVYNENIPSYSINLDPAVLDVSFGANIDIRDTVDYKQVMTQYGLGPNGGIVTSLNLFATQFEQVLQYAEKRAPELEYALTHAHAQLPHAQASCAGVLSFCSLYAATFSSTRQVKSKYSHGQHQAQSSLKR